MDKPTNITDETEDEYGNPMDGSRLIYCCFPDCGCDGHRLCMAENGASERCYTQNIEGMYSRNDPEAQKAKLALIVSVHKERTPNE